MNWKELVLDCVQDLCGKKKSREFTLDEIYRYESEMRNYYPNNNHIEDKIRQQLQYLRDEGLILFLDNDGTYQLI